MTTLSQIKNLVRKEIDSDNNVIVQQYVNEFRLLLCRDMICNIATSCFKNNMNTTTIIISRNKSDLNKYEIQACNILIEETKKEFPDIEILLCSIYEPENNIYPRFQLDFSNVE